MTRVRERRLEIGLTQAELASRAGVSRQLVAAVEAERNTPAVDAALRLARALGTTVEELFESPPPRAAAAVGDRVREGAALRVARVGERLVAAELADHGVAGAGWASADGVWERGELRLLPGASTDGLAVAGCEPAFGIAEQMLSGLGRRSVVAISAPTGNALAALTRQRVHAAVVHGPEGALPQPPQPVRRIHVARWRVGLAVPSHLHGGLEMLVGRTPVIQREPAASVQHAFERACGSLGLMRPAATAIATGHIEAARIAASRGCGSLTTEAAARAFELRFVPFEEHIVELWLGEEWLGHPGADALQELLSTSAFTKRVGRHGGYDLARCGEMVGS